MLAWPIALEGCLLHTKLGRIIVSLQNIPGHSSLVELQRNNWKKNCEGIIVMNSGFTLSKELLLQNLYQQSSSNNPVSSKLIILSTFCKILEKNDQNIF